jgi:phage-related minor tail protein
MSGIEKLVALESRVKDLEAGAERALQRSEELEKQLQAVTGWLNRWAEGWRFGAGVHFLDEL